MTRDKLQVAASGRCDQSEESSGSDAPGPVSDRTRSKMIKSHGASRQGVTGSSYGRQVSASSIGGGAGDVPATSGAQLSGSLNSANAHKEQEVRVHSDGGYRSEVVDAGCSSGVLRTAYPKDTSVGTRSGVQLQSGGSYRREVQLASKHRSKYSDVESSDVEDEEVHRSWGSTTELRHTVTDPLRLPCDSEIAIKASQFQIAQKASRRDQSCQSGAVSEPRKNSMKSCKNKTFQRPVQRYVSPCTTTAEGHRSRSMFKKAERATCEDASTDRRGRAGRTEVRSRPDFRPKRVMQGDQYTRTGKGSRSSFFKGVEVDDRRNYNRSSEWHRSSQSDSDSSPSPGRYRRNGKNKENKYRMRRYRMGNSSSDNDDSSPERKSFNTDRHYSFERKEKRRSCHGELGRRRDYMKPGKFDGNSCFETFLSQFDNCAQYNRWSDTDKLHYLRWSLTGVAAGLLWGTEEMGYNELVARLRSRFGSLDMEEKYQAELQCRRRKPTESLSELAQDVRRLMMLEYPMDRSTMSERLAKEHFICALDDPELELKVREKEPQTLVSALKYAQRLEVFRNAVRQRRLRMNRQVAFYPSSTSESLEDRVARVEENIGGCQTVVQPTPPLHRNKDGAPPRHSNRRALSAKKKEVKENQEHVRAAAVNSDNAWKDELQEKIRKLELAQQAAEAETKRFTAENEALNKEVERLRHLEQLRAVPVMPPPPPFLPSYRGPPRTYNTSCYNCGLNGHFAKDCLRPRPQTNAGVRYHSDNEMCNSAASNNSVPTSIFHDAYLRISINRSVYDCLLDTGSEVCLLPEIVAESAVLKETNRTLRAANGTVIPILGEVQLPVMIGNWTAQMTGLVSKHVAEPMLGIDFLVENKAVWDFDQSAVCFGDTWHQLRSRPDKRHWCRRVVLERDVEVPA